MYGFYNLEGCSDVFLISKDNGESPIENFKVTNYTKHGDLIVLYNKENIIGYHILKASKYFNELKLGLNFLNQEDLTILNQLLAESGLALETKDNLRTNDGYIVVGEVVECEKHPDSDHLHVCKVNVGLEKPLSIVCGANNVANQIKVIVAKIGAVLPGGLVIRKGELRKVESYGMLCSYKELGINKNSVKKQIAILDEKYEVGKTFFV